jgi:hypothetical protein
MTQSEPEADPAPGTISTPLAEAAFEAEYGFRPDPVGGGRVWEPGDYPAPEPKPTPYGLSLTDDRQAGWDDPTSRARQTLKLNLRPKPERQPQLWGTGSPGPRGRDRGAHLAPGPTWWSYRRPSAPATRSPARVDHHITWPSEATPHSWHIPAKRPMGRLQAIRGGAGTGGRNRRGITVAGARNQRPAADVVGVRRRPAGAAGNSLATTCPFRHVAVTLLSWGGDERGGVES